MVLAESALASPAASEALTPQPVRKRNSTLKRRDFQRERPAKGSLSTPANPGFSGSGGWESKKSGIYFKPRQQGFRVSVTRERDVSVVLFTSVPAIGFSRRSILTRDNPTDRA
jgi:hypothetical protein